MFTDLNGVFEPLCFKGIRPTPHISETGPKTKNWVNPKVGFKSNPFGLKRFNPKLLRFRRRSHPFVFCTVLTF